MIKEPLVVREFDKLVVGDDSSGNSFDDNVKKIDPEDFDSLKSLYDNEDNDDDASRFLRIGHNKKDGDYISVKKYVGTIHTSTGLQIEVLPKLDLSVSNSGNKTPAEKRTKDIFIEMLKSMDNFYGKTLNKSDLNVNNMDLYEVYIRMYIDEVVTLVKHGLKSGYVRTEDNLNVCKGKILFQQNIRYNFAHQERFYVEYDEFSADRPENRIIKATLYKLQRISSDFENVKRIRQCLAYFETVHESLNYDADFAKISINRGNQEYEDLMIWSKIFLKDESFEVFSGETRARAILFSMDKLYESYVAKKLREAVKNKCKNWVVKTQPAEQHLFDDPPSFTLRPDIVIKRKGNKPVILDTKWKEIKNTPKNNYGISQSDMYQMYAYATKYGTDEVWLLYPMNKAMNGKNKTENQIYFSSTQPQIKVTAFFVDIERIDDANIDDSIYGLIKLI